ncbi:2-amino-4-hydroxy-6-hydroxymethyldihydropteridine diphosphokinase [Falsiroseomonas sp. CW058]|uniref:2-amino-4-hydroxy-6- hydroxymethyldihydropteridine diphosphokinase n=1 Tax=Falsiroseomonas sp. CW058 TaxID=3388664 RepID=UPI003D3237D1
MILVALGANLPGPDGRPALETCRAAAARLDGIPGVRLRALSRWYSTAPVPAVSGVPDYVNGVALLEARRGCGAPDPARLLRDLQAIETIFGRVRPYRDAPRTLDLDLVGIGAVRRDTPDPVLPHPRMHARAFVLAPLCDVAPGWVHPGLGRSAAALLAEVDLAGIRVAG